MYTIQAFDPGSGEMEQFREIATRLYEGDPYWREAEDPPDDGSARCFIVHHDGVPVGRICSLINPMMRYHDTPAAVAGWYECADDPQASRALLDAAVGYAREKGFGYLIGPLNGSTWHRYRVADRSPNPPFFLDLHNKPWHAEQWEAGGFETIGGYLSSRFDDLGAPNDRIAKFERIFHEQGVRFRPIDVDAFDRELQILYDISLAGFAGNFLYTPISFAEFRGMYEGIRKMVDPRLVQIAENADGIGMGLIVTFPDFHDRDHRTLVVKTLVIRPDAPRGLGTYMVERMHRQAHELGFEYVIHALMYEKNVSANVLGGKSAQYRTYRLFGREV